MANLKKKNINILNNEKVILSLILLTALSLFLYKVGQESLWIDELYSVFDAKGLPETFSVERPLYYLVLRAWMFLGTTDWWMRSLSAIFSLASVFLTYKIARSIAGKSVGLTAAALLTISPLFINYAQMVRMYALSTSLGLAGTLALIHTLTSPKNIFIIGWVVARILMLLTTPTTVTLLVADLFLIGWKFYNQKSYLYKFAVAFTAIGIAFIPSFITSFTARGNLGELSSTSIPSINIILGKLRKFAVFPFPTPSKEVSLLFKGFTLIVWGLIGSAFLHKNRVKLLWISILAFFPVVASWLIDEGLFLTDRYILFVLPYFLILLGAGIVEIWKRNKLLYIALSASYVLAAGYGLNRYYTIHDRQDWRGMIETINSYEQEGDIVILSVEHNLSKAIKALGHYYKGDLPFYGLSKDDLSKPECGRLDFSITDLEGDPTRIWFICDSDPVLDENIKYELSQAFVNWGFYQENSYFHLFLINYDEIAAKNGDRSSNL